MGLATAGEAGGEACRWSVTSSGTRYGSTAISSNIILPSKPCNWFTIIYIYVVELFIRNVFETVLKEAGGRPNSRSQRIRMGITLIGKSNEPVQPRQCSQSSRGRIHLLQTSTYNLMTSVIHDTSI